MTKDLSTRQHWPILQFAFHSCLVPFSLRYATGTTVRRGERVRNGPMKREIAAEPGELVCGTVTVNSEAVRYSHVGFRSCRMCARAGNIVNRKGHQQLLRTCRQ